uniref:Uncharacterized protein n=1 Tax=Arundo donax TaxID=35708 RepID=A0A0A9DCG0_ARUDO
MLSQTPPLMPHLQKKNSCINTSLTASTHSS